MNHKNGNNTDHRLDNIEILCYNCYFIFIGNLNAATIRNTEKYISTSPDKNVTYNALDEGNQDFGDLLSDQEKIDMIKSIKGL